MQGVQFMNQSTNSQINLQQYNNDTYVVEKSKKEKIVNNQINVQNYGKQCNCGVKIEKKCCCPIGCPEGGHRKTQRRNRECAAAPGI